MKKCVSPTFDRIIAALAAIVCAIIAFSAFREFAYGNQSSIMVLAVVLLFGGGSVRTLYHAICAGNRGVFYDDEKVNFAFSRKDCREFRWDELKDAVENGEICISYQSTTKIKSVPAIWNFYFPDKKKIKQFVVMPRMAGYDELIAMLNEKEVPAEKAEPGDIVYNKEQLNKIYHEVFGENLGKDSKGK